MRGATRATRRRTCSGCRQARRQQGKQDRGDEERDAPQNATHRRRRSAPRPRRKGRRRLRQTPRSGAPGRERPHAKRTSAEKADQSNGRTARSTILMSPGRSRAQSGGERRTTTRRTAQDRARKGAEARCVERTTLIAAPAARGREEGERGDRRQAKEQDARQGTGRKGITQGEAAGGQGGVPRHAAPA